MCIKARMESESACKGLREVQSDILANMSICSLDELNRKTKPFSHLWWNILEHVKTEKWRGYYKNQPRIGQRDANSSVKWPDINAASSYRTLTVRVSIFPNMMKNIYTFKQGKYKINKKDGNERQSLRAKILLIWVMSTGMLMYTMEKHCTLFCFSSVKRAVIFH